MRTATLLAAALALAGAAPASTPTAADILSRMTALNSGLHSYTARVHFYIKLHTFISVPFRLNATYYFKRPDKSLLLFDSVPKQAQAFKHFYATRGTSESWPKLYGVDVVTDPPEGIYELALTPKIGGSLDHALIAVERHSYAEVHEDWFYHDGSAISVDTRNGKVGAYLVPVQQTGDFAFPSYKAHVVADFESYTFNADIPDKIFE